MNDLRLPLLPRASLREVDRRYEGIAAVSSGLGQIDGVENEEPVRHYYPPHGVGDPRRRGREARGNPGIVASAAGRERGRKPMVRQPSRGAVLCENSCQRQPEHNTYKIPFITFCDRRLWVFP